MNNKNGASIKETNQKFDFKGNFSGNIRENGLFFGHYKLVLMKSRLCTRQFKILPADVTNGTDIRTTKPEVQ